MKSLSRFKKFAKSRSINHKLPISDKDLSCFIYVMYDKENLSFSTISSNVSALSYHHKINNMPDPTKTFLIKQILIAIKKRRPVKDKRVAVTEQILKMLIQKLKTPYFTTYEHYLFKCIFIFQFLFALRIGEVTDTKHNLLFQNVSLKKSSVSLSFVSFKHSTEPITLKCKANNSTLCPVTALRNYLSHRGNRFGPLFMLHKKPLSQRFYNRKLSTITKSLQIQHVKSHSFRIGAATRWAQLGISEDEIKRRGRWSSDAFTSYIRGAISVG